MKPDYVNPASDAVKYPGELFDVPGSVINSLEEYVFERYSSLLVEIEVPDDIQDLVYCVGPLDRH